MDPQHENELLMHIAAGTDPLTALAALPREAESSVKSPADSSKRNSGYGWDRVRSDNLCRVVAAVAIVAIAAIYTFRF